jgi:hypothetical protein
MDMAGAIQDLTPAGGHTLLTGTNTYATPNNQVIDRQNYRYMLWLFEPTGADLYTLFSAIIKLTTTVNAP